MRFATLFAVMLLGCSSERVIKSRTQVLMGRLEKIERLGEQAAEVEVPTPRALETPLVLGNEYSGSNTLVVSELALNWWAKRAVCTTQFSDQTTKNAVNCSDEAMGSGSNCAAEVASVLRFGSFRKEETHSKESVELCVDWLSKLRYVIIIFDRSQQSPSTAEKHFSGFATLFDLQSGEAAARWLLTSEDNDELGGTTYLPNGQRARYILREASGPTGLARRALALSISKTFPNSKVDQYWKPEPSR